MSDEVVAMWDARLERLSKVCDKLDTACECVRDVTLETRMHMPEMVWPFKFVNKLAACRRNAHKQRIAAKKERAAAVENHKARVRVERMQLKRARDMNAKYKKLSTDIAGLLRERDSIENSMRAYGVEVQGFNMRPCGVEVQGD